jgi:adenine C2-methylase RlmN of 23S rRNA A2503 and tRNA A37
MPINRKYKLGLLLQTLREELRFKHNYKVLFEYVMLSGVNDRLDKPFTVHMTFLEIGWVHDRFIRY